MKNIIIKALSKTLNLDGKEIEGIIEIPPNSELGDYAFPCFSLAKSQKKSPAEIAGDLAKKIILTKEIEKVVAVGNYLNFFINGNFLTESTFNKILKEKENYGSQKIKEKVMVEFSQANTHKAFHIGHVRGTSLGESISRILEFSGNKVIRANYQGDTGMHVAKWIWCYKNYHQNKKLKKDEIWIASIYVEAVKRLEEDPELQNEVNTINKKLDTREDKELNKLWKKTRKLSLESFKPIYKELDTKFDIFFFESEIEKRGKEISNELLKRKIAEVSEGATIINLNNLGVWVLLRKDGTVLYSAKDLALAEKKFKKYKIDKAIYVAGNEQKLHFTQLFTTLKLMNFKQAGKCKHVPVTEVRLPEGKMSSRTGTNILYSQFKKELIEHTKQELGKRYKLSEKELNKRALAITIACLKYAMLKQDVDKTIVFKKEEAMQFEGNTGAYLLYTHARAKSILKKAKSTRKNYKIPQLTRIEKNIILQLSSFPDIVLNAYRSLAPNIIANYACELCQLFNEFYHSEKVIGSKNQAFLLTLVEAFSIVIKNTLFLIGIKPLEKM